MGDEMDQRDIELDAGDFRQVFTKPLTKPSELWKGVIVFGLMIGVTTAVALIVGGWTPLLMLLPTFWFAIGIAGLFPQFFFGKPD